jgi:hypothetical protein
MQAAYLDSSSGTASAFTKVEKNERTTLYGLAIDRLFSWVLLTL